MNSNKSKGLGDSIEKFTKATGIKKVVDAVSNKTGKDCGCSERRDTLNRVFPYNKDEKRVIKNSKPVMQ